MGRISQLAKEHKYIVAMAPAESYMDPSTPEFSLSLGFNHKEWEGLAPGFNYRGRNIYAALLAKYGKTIVGSESTGTKDTTEAIDTSVTIDTVESIDTFDFITIQLYEGYSHAKYRIDEQGDTAAQTILELVQALQTGWEVQFEGVPSLGIPNQVVKIHSTRVVIGLANAWAGDGKFLLIYPEEMEKVHGALVENGVRPKGYAYWNMKDEDIASETRPGDRVNMAKGLNAFLKIR